MHKITKELYKTNKYNNTGKENLTENHKWNASTIIYKYSKCKPKWHAYIFM